jgi:putative restriction endonuclease
LAAEDETRRDFAVAVSEEQRLLDASALGAPQREYVARLTKLRLHQPVFRARVLRAYAETCAMCRLHHAELLDSALHHPGRSVPRHAVRAERSVALQAPPFGLRPQPPRVRPDLVIEVQRRVLDEIDGPGTPEMAGARLLVPRIRGAQPNPPRLEERYAEFLATG